MFCRLVLLPDTGNSISELIALIILKWVLRRIFGPKRDEVTGDWRKLHNKELHGLYSSPSITE
jgi:hypothetical protein